MELNWGFKSAFTVDGERLEPEAENNRELFICINID